MISSSSSASSAAAGDWPIPPSGGAGRSCGPASGDDEESTSWKVSTRSP
jgi:hypothetical protein